MIRTFLLLGSNEGDRAQALRDARASIASRVGTIAKLSTIYQTAAWGNTAQPPFFNQVLEIETKLEPIALLEALQQIEAKLGRIRDEKWGPRVIDIDILFYGDVTLSTPSLTVPHPGIPARRFTLVPLAEIAADFIHPTIKKTMRQLLESCDDTLTVERIP